MFYYYECKDCGTIFRSLIPPELKEKAQYGNNIQALALSLMNTTNVPINKTAMFLFGITEGQLSPCEGYIAKLQKRAAKRLKAFQNDLFTHLIKLTLMYWDDTVIMINTKRACMRFYGNEKIAYYTAHMHKDMASLDDDKILESLTSETKTMHDHNKVNYNDKYSFENIECNQHLQRDCQKNSDDTCHVWSTELKQLISNAIHERKLLIEKGIQSFDSDYINKFNKELDNCLEKGWQENARDPDNYGSRFEKTLLERIAKYRDNYFSWVEDFTLPTTNNLAERGLRGIKSHMKVSGQFESVEAARNHAVIKTYIETCRRNGINEITALQRLCTNNPYTVEEIFGT